MNKQEILGEQLEDLREVRKLLSNKLLSGELNVSATATLGEIFVKVCGCEVEALKVSSPPKVKSA